MDAAAEPTGMRPYEPPTIERLGTLTELTHGSAAGAMDMLGGCDSTAPPPP